MYTKRFAVAGAAVWVWASFGTVCAQERYDAAGPALAAPAVQASPLSMRSTPHAYLDPRDVAFAHIAVGGVWRTSFFIVNMSSNTIPYTISYYDDNGNPMAVPVLMSDGTYQRVATANYTIRPFGENNYDLWNSSSSLQAGQAILSYDHTLGQLGGFSVFQEAAPGQPIYEATVALSGSDWKLYLPYYHYDGYTSGVAISNPSLVYSTNVTLTAVDNSGNSLLTDTIYLPPGGHYAFSVTDRYPQLNNRRGNLYLESSSQRLAAVGLRFAPGGSYTTIPIMNWTGMF